jgi:site-specific DNA recombinase
MNQHKKRAAIYARNATIQELIPGYAEGAQVHDALAYLRAKGYQLVPDLIYSEVASGTAVERPGLAALLDAARRGEFEVLVVFDHDRLSRSPSQLGTLLADFQQQGVQVESINEPHQEAAQ